MIVDEDENKDGVLCFDFTRPSSVKRKSRFESRFSRFLQNSHFAVQSEPEIEIFSDKRVALTESNTENKIIEEDVATRSTEKTVISPVVNENERETNNVEVDEKNLENKQQQEEIIEKVQKDDETIGIPENGSISMMNEVEKGIEEVKDEVVEDLSMHNPLESEENLKEMEVEKRDESKFVDELNENEEGNLIVSEPKVNELNELESGAMNEPLIDLKSVNELNEHHDSVIPIE